MMQTNSDKQTTLNFRKRVICVNVLLKVQNFFSNCFLCYVGLVCSADTEISLN